MWHAYCGEGGGRRADTLRYVRVAVKVSVLRYSLRYFVVCVGRSGGGGTGTVCHVGAAVTVSFFVCTF